MRPHARPLTKLALVLCISVVAGCRVSDAGEPTASQVLASGVGTPAATPGVDARATPAATTTALTTFPSVDISALDAAGLSFFSKLANDETCPCDCPKSFAQCLQEGTQCKPAVLLATWLVSQLSSGVPGEFLAEPIARELHGGFSAPPAELLLAGYAAKGAAQPKYTVVEFADFECTHCRAASPVLDELAKRPDVRVIYKHFPLSTHPNARAAAIAAEAAGRQGKFWEMHHAIFATQDFLSDEILLGHAKALGLDVARFQKDLVDPALAKLVDDSRKEGEKLHISATPSFFVNGRPYQLSRSMDGFELRFAMEDARATSSCR